MSLESYLDARPKFLANSRGTFSFPVLLLFDRDGNLVYRGDSLQSNHTLLAGLPGSVLHLHALAPPVRVNELIARFPQLQELHPQIYSRKRFLILTVETEGCGACTTQAGLLDDAKSRLPKPIDLVALRIRVPTS